MMESIKYSSCYTWKLDLSLHIMCKVFIQIVVRLKKWKIRVRWLYVVFKQHVWHDDMIDPQYCEEQTTVV